LTSWPEALKAEKVILIGHSMGGVVALEAARHLSGIVAGVLLVDTFVIDYGGLSAEAVQTIAAPFAENFMAAMVNLIEQTSTTATPPELKQQLIREMAAADPTWALPVWSDLLSWNPQAAFKELQMPIHAINGFDTGISPRTLLAFHYRDTDSRCRTLFANGRSDGFQPCSGRSAGPVSLIFYFPHYPFPSRNHPFG